MTTRLIQRMALRLLSAGVFSFCALTASPAPAGDVDPGKARLEAIKVELALLNDASGYSQPLTVRVEAGGVEVQGTVASEAVRQRVLEIARRSCYLPIHDRIAVAGQTSRAMVPLVKAAHDRLVRELGAQADAIKIQPEAGKLRLTGRVRSVEDKLHASRTLRGLAGCGGLVNNLEVKPDAGPSFTLVMHADEDALADPVPQAAPATPTAPVATLPSGLPPVAPVPASPDASGWGKGSPYRMTVALPPAGPKEPAPVEEPKAAPIAPANPVTPVAMAPAVEDAPAPRLTEWPPAHRTGPATPLPAGATYQSHPLGHLLRTQAAKPVSQLAELKPVAATTPAAVKQPAVVTKVAAPKPSDVIRKVKAAAGSFAREIRTETGADGVLAVHVYATPGSERMLTARLFDVPELTQSNVRLHVHLTK